MGFDGKTIYTIENKCLELHSRKEATLAKWQILITSLPGNSYLCKVLTSCGSRSGRGIVVRPRSGGQIKLASVNATTGAAGRANIVAAFEKRWAKKKAPKG